MVFNIRLIEIINAELFKTAIKCSTIKLVDTEYAEGLVLTSNLNGKLTQFFTIIKMKKNFFGAIDYSQLFFLTRIKES